MTLPPIRSREASPVRLSGVALTRRCYIRRKYQRDVEFRGAVDRYVGEFESILAKVSRARRDAASEIGYLASESGKIYTMLAHAAGRLD